MKSSFTYVLAAFAAIFCLFFCQNAAAQTPPSKLVMGEAGEWPFSYNVLAVHPSQGMPTVPIAQFTIASTGNDSLLREIYVEVTGSTSVHLLYLYKGNERFMTTNSENRTTGTLSSAIDIDDGLTETYTVMAWFYDDAPVNSPVFRAKITGFSYYNSAFQFIVQNVNILGPTLHCFGKYADYQLASPASILTVPNQQGTDAHVVAAFPLSAKAYGAAAGTPQASDFDIMFTDIFTGQQYPATDMSVALDGTGQIPMGSTRNAMLTTSLSMPGIRADSLYHAKLTRVRWRVGTGQSTVQAEQDWGFENVVTPITNASMPEAGSIDVLASRLFATAAAPNQSPIMIITAPKKDFLIESSTDKVNWTNLGLSSATSEVAILPNRLRVFNVPLPADSVSSSRAFFRPKR